MRINTRVRYAIRMMADIAKHSGGEPVRVADIAGRQGLSKFYLDQLGAPLRHANLLKSVRGKKGGYMLNRVSNEIKLIDIIEAVDGPVCLMDCVLDPGQCDRSDFCECIGIWRDINAAMVTALEKYSLADLVDTSRSVSRLGSLCMAGRSAEEA